MPRTTEVVLDILVEAGIDHVFGMPGGAALFLYDALVDRQDQLRPILARHESGASCMADMYGRLTGKPGVVVAQGAWAGSNAGLGIMEAYLAGSPMLILADVSDYGGLIQHAPYQNAGGEYGSIDLPGIMRSMTKYTTVANSADEFAHGTQLAIKHATTGRPGPACVLFRWDVSVSKIEPDGARPRLYPTDGHLRVSVPSIAREDAEAIADLLHRASDPVMIIGRGVHVARAFDEVRGLAEQIGMPVASTFMGKSGIPETHDLALGTIGAIGQQVANEKVAGADVILAVGTCLAPENTKMLSPDFINPERQKIIQIDTEPLHIGWIFPVTLGVTADAKSALRAILDVLKERPLQIDAAARVRELKALKEKSNFFTSEASTSDASPIAPQRIIHALNQTLGLDETLVLDGGNNRMFSAKLFQSKRVGQVIGPGGVAGIGWSVPAALAAQLVQPERRVVCVCGDGGMMMQLYSLAMAREYDLPVTYVVLNNSCLGNVYDFQAADRKIATEYREQDFARIAEAMGCMGTKIEKPGDLEGALKRSIESDQPALLDISTAKQPHFELMSG